MKDAGSTPRGDGRIVLLDVDGTLVDSNDAHARAWVAALTEAGYRVPLARVRKLIGMGGDKLLAQVTGLDPASERSQRILARRRQIFLSRELPSVQAFPATRALVERLIGDGVRLAIASAADEEELNPLLIRAGIAHLVPVRVNSSETEQSKPDPDVVDIALRKLGSEPAEAFLIGDTPYDVEAGARAGVRVIGFRSGGWPDAGLRGAQAIYDGPAHLLADYAASPLGRRDHRPRPDGRAGGWGV